MMQAVHPEAIRLLRKSCFLEGKNFICFGRYYRDLKKLNLIDNEMHVTFLGRKFVQHCMDQGFFDE